MDYVSQYPTYDRCFNPLDGLQHSYLISAFSVASVLSDMLLEFEQEIPARCSLLRRAKMTRSHHVPTAWTHGGERMLDCGIDYSEVTDPAVVGTIKMLLMQFRGLDLKKLDSSLDGLWQATEASRTGSGGSIGIASPCVIPGDLYGHWTDWTSNATGSRVQKVDTLPYVICAIRELRGTLDESSPLPVAKQYNPSEISEAQEKIEQALKEATVNTEFY